MLQITFNDERCKELYRELGLKKEVRIRVYNRPRRDRRTGQMVYMGQLLSESSWTPEVHQVVVEAGNHEKLTGLELKKQVVMTYLHECRHAHQHEHWPPEKWAAELALPYARRPSEIDAESWAKANWREWADVLTIRRVTSTSRFGKLSAAAERAKNG